MDRLAPEIGFAHCPQHRVPALIQAVEDLHRDLGIQRGVGEPGPFRFVVGLDGRAVFRQSQDLADKLKSLQKKLEKAIANEDFETAATLRDEVKALRAQMSELTTK